MSGRLRVAAYLLVGWYVLYAVLLTVLQWQVWSNDAFTRLLLALPLSSAVPLSFWFELVRPLFERPGGYFAFYSFGRFWMPAVLAVVAALLWCGVIRLTRLARLRVFSKEAELFSFVAALIAGWPRIVVFIPLVIVFALFSALFHKVRGTTPTSLFIPIACAVLSALLSSFAFPLMI